MSMPDEIEREFKQNYTEKYNKQLDVFINDIKKEPKVFDSFFGMRKGKLPYRTLLTFSKQFDLGKSPKQVINDINTGLEKAGLSQRVLNSVMTKKEREQMQDGGKLVGGQKELDKNNDGDITGEDFAILREEREAKQVGGMMMDDQMADMMEEKDKMPMDNQMAEIMPEEQKLMEAQVPDEKMEENYVDFLIDEALSEEEDTAMPVQQEPVRQDIRVTKETVDSQAAMQDEEDLVGDEIKKSMLSGRPHVRS